MASGILAQDGRSLEEALADLIEKLNKLPNDSPDRRVIDRMIEDLESESRLRRRSDE